MIGGKPILQLITEFLADHQGSFDTKKKYRVNLNVFVNWLTVAGVDHHAVTRADLIRYIEYLKQSGRAEQTQVNYFVPVRQFFSYLDDCGLYKNVAKNLHASVKDQIFKKKPLSPDQVTKLLQSISRETLIGKRDYAIINLMVRMGLRCVEVCRLDVGDFISEDDQMLMKIHRKGRQGKDDIQGITDKVFNPIQEYFIARGIQPKEPAFINHGYAGKGPRVDPKTISRIIKERLKVIGINDPLLSAHSLRHTAAVTAINQGVDLFHVRALMGHKDVRTTMIYLKYIEEQTKKKGIAAHAIDKAY